MDDKSWNFYDNIRYNVLQFCQILLGKPCSDKDCLDHMKRCGTYDGWLSSWKHIIGKSNDYLKQTELEDAILDWLMNIEKPNNLEANTFQRCLLYEKRCSEMKVRGEKDAKSLFDFILNHALKKKIPENKQLGILYPLDCVSIWISLNKEREAIRNKYMGGEWVLLSENTINKLSKAKAEIQRYVYDKILSFQISDEAKDQIEAKEQIVGELFGSDAVANMPKKKDESEKAQKNFLRKLWDIFKDESTPKPKIRKKGQNPAVEFSVVAYFLFHEEFSQIKVNTSKFYRWLDETKGDNSFKKMAAYKPMRAKYFKHIGNSSTLEEAIDYVNKKIDNPKQSVDREDNKVLLKDLKEFLELKEIYKEKLDNNERRA